jgi:hypothetical protein
MESSCMDKVILVHCCISYIVTIERDSPTETNLIIFQSISLLLVNPISIRVTIPKNQISPNQLNIQSSRTVTSI